MLTEEQTLIKSLNQNTSKSYNDGIEINYVIDSVVKVKQKFYTLPLTVTSVALAKQSLTG